jgi:hypothetical protein
MARASGRDPRGFSHRDSPQGSGHAQAAPGVRYMASFSKAVKKTGYTLLHTHV